MISNKLSPVRPDGRTGLSIVMVQRHRHCTLQRGIRMRIADRLISY